MGLPALRSWPVEAPLLNAGAPFELIGGARTPANQNVEPAPSGFQIDLAHDRIAITIPGLRPARESHRSQLSGRIVVDDTKASASSAAAQPHDPATAGRGCPSSVSSAIGSLDPDAPWRAGSASVSITAFSSWRDFRRRLTVVA
jgi:hypothetical protein